MDVSIRPVQSGDVEACARICLEAFRRIALAHGFPPDFTSIQSTRMRLSELTSFPGTAGFVAEAGGRVVGSNFIHDRRPVATIGPITVDPASQERDVGRALMEAALAWARDRRLPSVRLVQAAYNTHSLALYAKLGFVVREPLSCMQGDPPAERIGGRTVREARSADVPACNDLCRRVHGHDREIELRFAVERGGGTVVTNGAGITGYAAGIGFGGHAVAETNEDLEALIGGASAYAGPGFLLPTRNGEVLRWCLENGLRVVQPMTLMTMGSYQEPSGPFLPSIGF